MSSQRFCLYTRRLARQLRSLRTQHALKTVATRHRVSFDRFQHFILRAGVDNKHVTRAAIDIAASAPFQHDLDRYLDEVHATVHAFTQHRAQQALFRVLNSVQSLAKVLYPEYVPTHRIHYGEHKIRAVGHTDTAVLNDSGYATASSASTEATDDDRDPTSNLHGTCIAGMVSSSPGASFKWHKAAVVMDLVTPSYRPEEDSGPEDEKNYRILAKRGAKRRQRWERPSSPSPPAKRSRTGHQTWRYVEERESGRAPQDHDLSLQVEKVFLEGARHHVLGMSFRDEHVRFHYYDRAGTIYSNFFNLTSNPVKFVEAILELALCTDSQLGLNEIFQVPTDRYEIDDTFGNVVGTHVKVDSELYIVGKPIARDSSMYGRGTHVYRATRLPHPPGEVSSETETVTGISGSRGPHNLPEEVVLKIAWYDPSYKHEDGLLREAFHHQVGGIIQLQASAVVGKLSNGPRGGILAPIKGKDKLGINDYELRLQILGPQCVELSKIPDIPTFKKAFIATVKALFCSGE